MTEVRRRRVYSADFKAKVGLEAVRGARAVNEIALSYGVHPVMVSQWKKEILANAGMLFECKRGPKGGAAQDDQDRLHGEIGRLKLELDWLRQKAES